MRACRFCRSALEIAGTAGVLDTWRCPTCGCEEGHGLEKLPDPDRLRERADELEQLADEIETSELASRFEVTP